MVCGEIKTEAAGLGESGERMELAGSKKLAGGEVFTGFR